MTTRGIRRKKSSLSEVKVAVLGAQSVGKSGKDMWPLENILTTDICLSASILFVHSSIPSATWYRMEHLPGNGKCTDAARKHDTQRSRYDFWPDATSASTIIKQVNA